MVCYCSGGNIEAKFTHNSILKIRVCHTFGTTLGGLNDDNLVADRLNKLVEDQLVEKVDGSHGTVVYELSSHGARIGEKIFVFAVFGGQFKPEGETHKPGNLRTVATTLGAAAKCVATPDMNLMLA